MLPQKNILPQNIVVKETSMFTDQVSQKSSTLSQNWQQPLPFSAQQSSAFVQLFNNDRNYQQTGQTAETMFDQFTASSSREREDIPQKIPNVTGMTSQGFTSSQNWQQPLPFSAQQSSAFVQLFNNDRNYQQTGQTAETMFDQFTASSSREREDIPQKIPNVTGMTSQGFTSSQNWQQPLPFSAQQSSAFVQLFNNDRNYQQTGQTAKTMFDQFTASSSREREDIPQKIPNVTGMTSQEFTSSQNWQQPLPFSAQQSSAFVQLFNNDRNYQQTGQTAKTMFDQFTASSSREREDIPQKIPNVTGMTSQEFTSSQNWQQPLPFSAQQSSISTQIPHLQSNSYENYQQVPYIPQETYDQTITLNNSENTDGRTTDQFCIDNNEGKELSLSSDNSGRTANKILSELTTQHGKELAIVMYTWKEKPIDSIIEDYNKKIPIRDILTNYCIDSKTLQAIIDWAIKNDLSKYNKKPKGKKYCIIKEINDAIPKKQTVEKHKITSQRYKDIKYRAKKKGLLQTTTQKSQNVPKDFIIKEINAGIPKSHTLKKYEITSNQYNIVKYHAKKNGLLQTTTQKSQKVNKNFIIKEINDGIPKSHTLKKYEITSNQYNILKCRAKKNGLLQTTTQKSQKVNKNFIIKEINDGIPKSHTLKKYEITSNQYNIVKYRAKKKGLLQTTTQKSQNVQNSSLNPLEASVSKRCDTIQPLPFLNAKEVEEHLKTI